MNYDSNICFYHGKLSREGSETLLKESGTGNGTFLVRDSNTSTGDYVLSVLSNDEVIHFQIRKHEDDAFFSIDESTICHGLETLVEHYQEQKNGTITRLKNPIVKDPPPPDTRRHGRTNLLHRATKEGNVEIVVELLKSGNRSLEAKNHEGQTAVHLACQIGHNEILEKLIARGTNVNCRDSEGNTPLHYACHRNSPSTIQILVDKGGANVQMRNTKTEWVALHEATSRGYIDCTLLLLQLKAPLRPRTKCNELPLDLARQNGHQECTEILANYESPAPNTKKSDWYHGTLGRSQAVEILKNASENGDGCFLVRYSSQSGYALTMLCLEQDYHFKILQSKNSFYFIDDGPYLDSLEHLIEHYMTIPDGLPCKLRIPIPPKPSPPLPSSPHPSSFATLPKSYPKKNQKSPSVEISDVSSLSIHHASTLPLPSKKMSPKLVDFTSKNDLKSEKTEKKDAIIPRDNIILREVIGGGEFGTVKRGILQNREGYEEEVAVKTLHINITESSQKEFLREAAVMMELNHECIVKFIGICVEPELLMVLELTRLGSVLQYVTEYPNLVSPTYDIVIWASQIARGMEYLEKERFVHRDLAARNILLASEYQIKITDFGLSRTLCTKDYYRATEGGRWPIKWYAPESYNFGTFSSASDVWSFAITLWELYSYGQTPYGTLKGSEVTNYIDGGGRLQKPRRCSSDVYEIMAQCWEYSPLNRPRFSELVEKFKTPEYTNVVIK